MLVAFLLVAPNNSFAYKIIQPPNQVSGARVVKEAWRVPLQTRLFHVAPGPSQAKKDYPKSRFDGCGIFGKQIVSPPCVYGDVKSKKTVVLFGDSRAQQYFAPIEKIAEERNLRLVVLVRGNCFPAFVFSYEYFCDTWKQNALKRIVSEEKPKLVILGSATKEMYSVQSGTLELSRNQSQEALVNGTKTTIKMIENIGSKVIIIRDQTFTPKDIDVCVKSNLDNLGRCSFAPTPRFKRAFELQAALETGVRVIDPQSMFCSRDICPAIIGSAFVYRDTYHITDTFALTLTPWFRERIYSL